MLRYKNLPLLAGLGIEDELPRLASVDQRAVPGLLLMLHEEDERRLLPGRWDEAARGREDLFAGLSDPCGMWDLGLWICRQPFLYINNEEGAAGGGHGDSAIAGKL